MFDPHWLYLGIVPPVIIAALAMVVWCQPWRPPSQYSYAMAWVVALLDAFLACSLGPILLKRALPWPPPESSYWILYAVAPAVLVVELLCLQTFVPNLIRIAMRLGLAVATPLIVLNHYLYNLRETPSDMLLPLALCAGFSLLLIVVWVSFGRLHRAEPQTRTPALVLAGVTLMAGLILLLSGTVTGAQTTITLGMALLGVLLGSLIVRHAIEPAGAYGVVLVLLTALLLNGAVLANLKLWHAALLLAAPLASWITQWNPVWRLRAWQTAAVACAAAALVASPALIDAIITFIKRSADTSGY